MSKQQCRIPLAYVSCLRGGDARLKLGNSSRPIELPESMPCTAPSEYYQACQWRVGAARKKRNPAHEKFMKELLERMERNNKSVVLLTEELETKHA